MKRYRLTAAASFHHVPEHPERTAKRDAGTGLDFDVEYQTWPSSGAMRTSLAMQGRRPPTSRDWRAVR